MPVIDRAIEPLVAGERLTFDEFIRRWESMPDLKRAELIGGIVRMAPLSADHADSDQVLAGLIVNYRLHTPGCAGGASATWHMLGDAPQPDQHLRILPSYGGQSRVKGKFCDGAPELIFEVCYSSVRRDLKDKKKLYFSAGVIEYMTVLNNKDVRWYVRGNHDFHALTTDKNGVFRSRIFPGFWLNAPALLAADLPRLISTLYEGVNSPEHAAFVRKLAAAKRK
jgi:Uma2 family endonuclease